MTKDEAEYIKRMVGPITVDESDQEYYWQSDPKHNHPDNDTHNADN